MKKNLPIVAGLVGLFVVSYLFGVRFLKSNQAPAPTPAPTAQTETTPTSMNGGSFSLVPSSATIRVGQGVPVSVELTGDTVQAADVSLTFDPRFVQVSDIKATANFPVLIKQSAVNGKMMATVSISPEKSQSPAAGSVVTFILKGVAPAPSTRLDFVTAETVAAKDGNNILTKMTGGMYVVVN